MSESLEEQVLIKVEDQFLDKRKRNRNNDDDDEKLIPEIKMDGNESVFKHIRTDQPKLESVNISFAWTGLDFPTSVEVARMTSHFVRNFSLANGASWRACIFAINTGYILLKVESLSDLIWNGDINIYIVGGDNSITHKGEPNGYYPLQFSKNGPALNVSRWKLLNTGKPCWFSHSSLNGQFKCKLVFYDFDN